MATLTEQEIRAQLDQLNGWTSDGMAIEKRFQFDDFNAAMTFMAAAAPKIDALDHHPEWANVYNRVDVRLTSHDAGGLTKRDFALAHVLEEVVAEM
ncbi:MAG: 4a-hydroxytetrahydrobiopterin dehydratase [Aeromicrobium sp.]